MAGDTGQQQPPESTRRPSIPVLQPPDPQMLVGPVVYVPGVLRAGPGNRPVFHPSPVTSLPMYFNEQQMLSPLSAGSSAASPPVVSPLLVSPLSPTGQQLQVEAQSRGDQQSQRGHEAKASQRAEPEPELEAEPGSGLRDKGPENEQRGPAAPRPTKGWRPKWLRRWVICGFAVWFVILLVLVEVLANVASRDGSLAVEPGPEAPCLWIAGLAAIFTVTTALWDRVNYQSMRFMPWIQMAREPSDAERSISLDYLSHRLLPTAIIAALRNRHYLVACSGVVALFLRLLTVLSTGLVFLNGIPVTSVASVSVLDVFSSESIVADSSPDRVPNTAYAQLQAMVDEGVPPPFGYADSTAFQTFTRPSGNDMLKVVVDGLWADMECVPATIDARVIPADENRSAVLNITSTSRLCERGDTETRQLGSAGQLAPYERLLYFGKQGEAWCGAGGDGMFALAYYTVSETRLARGVGAHCRPRYRMGKATVTATEHSVDIKRMDSPASSPVGWPLTRLVDGIWDRNLPNSDHVIVTSTVPHIGSDAYARDTTNIRDVPAAIHMGLQLERGKAPGKLEGLDSETLARAVAGFYRNFVPLLAHAQLRKQAGSTVEGESTVSEKRLLVHPVFCHIMAAILAGSAVLAAASATVLLRGAAYPPTSPETIIGMALDLMHSSKLFRKLSGTGQLSLARTAGVASGTYRAVQKPADGTTSTSTPAFSISCASEPQEVPNPAPDIELESGETEASHRPFYLQVFPRAAVLVVLVVFIGVLVVFQRVSHNNAPRGLADVGDTTYSHYLWTSVPTLLAVILTTFFSAVDTHTRALSGFLFLEAGQGTATAAQLLGRLADRTALSGLGIAIGAKAYAAIASATAALLAACITIASGTVFALDPASRRVIINCPAVFIVLSLLVALMLVGVLTLGLLARRIAPKAPGSILAMASLLADSNVFGELRQGAEYMTRKEVESLFVGKRFRMGWFERDGRMVYTIGVEDGM